MDLGIQGKWALVCGASKGLGRACAQALINEGVNVVIVARQAGNLERTQHELQAGAPGVTVLACAADITTPEGQQAALSVAGGPGNAFDILVTNAGGPPPGDFRDWDQATWQAALQANMLTPIALTRAVVDGMAERGFGRILHITSSAVKAPIDVLGLSNGARSGLTGFMAGLARSGIAARNVTINQLLPGPFATDRLNSTLNIMAGGDPERRNEVEAEHIRKVPVRRFGEPQEFGAFCAFLCSQYAGYLVGQNILLDGGMYPGVL